MNSTIYGRVLNILNVYNFGFPQGEMVQNILRIYLETSGSTSDLLDELACTILPQVHGKMFLWALLCMKFDAIWKL